MLRRFSSFRFQRDKRRRLKLPWSIRLIAGIFIVMPLLNLAAGALTARISIFEIGTLLGRFDLTSLVLMFSAPLVGIGILFINRWTFRIFILYALLLLANAAYAFVSSTEPYTLGILLRSGIGLLAVLYFLNRDVRVPYLEPREAGFRRSKRRPASMDVEIDGNRFSCLDISNRGCYVEWPNCGRETGAQVEVRLEGVDKPLQAGVVRIDERGVGLAWRNPAAFQLNQA